jgi:hypothetical protein
MAALILLAAVVALITGAGLGALAIVVLGIHQIDGPENRLTDAARTPADAATRRLLGLGAHTPAHVCEEEQE